MEITKAKPCRREEILRFVEEELAIENIYVDRDGAGAVVRAVERAIAALIEDYRRFRFCDIIFDFTYIRPKKFYNYVKDRVEISEGYMKPTTKFTPNYIRELKKRNSFYNPDVYIQTIGDRKKIKEWERKYGEVHQNYEEQ